MLAPLRSSLSAASRCIRVNQVATVVAQQRLPLVTTQCRQFSARLHSATRLPFSSAGRCGLNHLASQKRQFSTTPADSQDADLASITTDGQRKRKIHKNTEKDLWEVVRLVREDHCSDVVTIDVRTRSPSCDFFVIATCRAGRHMQAVSDLLVTHFKDRRRKGETLAVEGEVDSEWMIVNMSDIQVHLMQESQRKRLELEKLWTLGEDDDQLRQLEDSRPELFI